MPAGGAGARAAAVLGLAQPSDTTANHWLADTLELFLICFPNIVVSRQNQSESGAHHPLQHGSSKAPWLANESRHLCAGWLLFRGTCGFSSLSTYYYGLYHLREHAGRATSSS